MNQIKKIKLSQFLLTVFVALLVVACDTLQKDSVPKADDIKIANNVIYLTPQSSGIIDLSSMVQSAQSVKLSAGQPRMGKLDPYDKDLLKYTPQSGFTGTDRFTVSFYTQANDFIKKDSVSIIVKTDSTNLPCGRLWIQNDFVTNVLSATEINVLGNDKFCGIQKSALKLSIAVQLPKNGTVEVLPSLNLRYTPKADFPGYDAFIYRVEKPENIPNAGDPAAVGFGVVYLSGASDVCRNTLILYNDVYQYKLSNINPLDTIYFFPTANDSICRVIPFKMTLKSQPQGKAIISQSPSYSVKYVLPPGAAAGFTDTFTYGICADVLCKEAEIKVVLN